MPGKYFLCSDGKKIEITKCLEKCRLKDRCCPRPVLRVMAYDRKYKGVSPSAAGNGPRLIWLKATTDYTIDPGSRIYALMGSGMHDKVSMHEYTYNVMSEEPLSDEKMKGIPDVLESSETKEHFFDLYDYKTSGSFAVARKLGRIKHSVDEPVLDKDGNEVILKSGKNRGKVKTKKRIWYEHNANIAKRENLDWTLQINRYRIFFEGQNFPIDKMEAWCCPRDGGTYAARANGIEERIIKMPIERLPNEEVLRYYDNLQAEVDQAFKDGWIRKCNKWETWDERRCNGYCEVSEACQKLDKEKSNDH